MELAGLGEVNTFYVDGNTKLDCPLLPKVQTWLEDDVEFNGAC